MIFGENAPAICEDHPGEKYFNPIDGYGLTVPNYADDEKIRWLMSRGMPLVDAYNEMGLNEAIPPQGMRACISDALTTKYYDAKTDLWKPQPPGAYTCTQYWECFVDFIEAMRRFKTTGRTKIGEDAYVPSPEEQECIRSLYARTKNVPAAYASCGTSEILPWWNGGVAGLATALSTDITVNFYPTLKASFMFTQIPTPTPPETTPPINDNGAEPEKKPFPTWAYGAMALALGLFVTRRKS